MRSGKGCRCWGVRTSGRIITKQCNLLSLFTICDLMQYKRWMTRHGIDVTNIVDDERWEMTNVESREIDIKNKKNWRKRMKQKRGNHWTNGWRYWQKIEKLSERARRLAAFRDVAWLAPLIYKIKPIIMLYSRHIKFLVLAKSWAANIARQ